MIKLCIAFHSPATVITAARALVTLGGGLPLSVTRARAAVMTVAGEWKAIHNFIIIGLA